MLGIKELGVGRHQPYPTCLFCNVGFAICLQRPGRNFFSSHVTSVELINVAQFKIHHVSLASWFKDSFVNMVASLREHLMLSNFMLPVSLFPVCTATHT